ncbi:MAG: LuxR C-terminal-related transcriptional regulator [Firmicutes bacterium]|nr:LuxR C-terminal-related transcriptional regulator [Bacillota bacterium]
MKSLIGKKALALIAATVLVLFFGFLGFQNITFASEDFYSGSGTYNDPFIITEAEHLFNIRENADSQYYFKLGNNIDLKNKLDEGLGWDPIGTLSDPFCGELDGNGYSIINLFIDRQDEDYVGLFGYAVDTTIKNLNIVLAPQGITGGDCVGGFVGCIEDGSIENCSIAGTLSAAATTSVSGLGGLVGIATNTEINNCYFKGNILGVIDYAGGLVGFAQDVLLENCYVKATIDVEGVSGGIFGYGSLDSSILRSYTDIVSISDTDIFVGELESVHTRIDRYSYFVSHDLMPLPGIYDREVFLDSDQLKKQIEYIGFDFNSVWGIYEHITTPYLKSFNNVILIEPDGKVYDGTNIFNEEVKLIGNYYEDKPIEVTFADIDREQYITAGLYDAGINYETEFAYQVFIAPYEISKAVLTVKANDCSQNLGGVGPVFDYTITGFMESDDIGVIDQLSLSSIVISLQDSNLHRGENIIEISGELYAANYTFEFENGVLTVSGLYTYEIVLITIGAIIVLALFVYILYLVVVKKKTFKDFGRAVKRIFVKEKSVEIIKEVPMRAKPLPTELFTPREKEVAELLLSGKSRSQIAQMLFISEHTVKSHTQNVFEKTEVNNQRAFIAKYLIGNVEENQEEEF